MSRFEIFEDGQTKAGRKILLKLIKSINAHPSA